MTPKQCAAKLLLDTLSKGSKHPKQQTREEMTTQLGTRISDEKREKVLQFVEKIEGPFRERLAKLCGEGGEEAAGEG